MWYQPKFCSECGEKIVRAEWKFWYSRQFCDLCSTKHQVFDMAGRFSILLVPILMVGFAATAFTPGKSGNQIQSVAPPTRGFVSEGTRKELKPTSEVAPKAAALSEQQDREASVKSPDQKTAVTQRSPDEVYLCGAPTKKGTACTRRVKIKGFCWQHKEAVP